jgi:hypothetical protein
MAEAQTMFETLEFRVALVDPSSHALLVLDLANGDRLPRVRIPRWLRPAQQLQKEIHATWGVRVVILDIVREDCGSASLVVAEPLMFVPRSDFKTIMAGQLPSSEVSEKEYVYLTSLLKGVTKEPFSRVGWIDRAVRWVESETGSKLASRNEIEQYNAGGAFALVRFPMTGGCDYWLKATGEPNRHEPAVMTLLSELGGGYVPDVIASRPEWNAVLLSGAAKGIAEIPDDPRQALELLGNAVESMAKLQIKTEGHGPELLEAGAFDQGMDLLLKRAPDLFDYLEEVMGLHASVESPRLERKRIREIRSIFQAICERSQRLGIPETIVHGDMNPGNIVIGCGQCQFIDWSEAYVANCLVALQHLLLLNRTEEPDLRDFMNSVLKRRYLDAWLTVRDATAFQEGFAYMSLLGAVSALYGRGDWLTSPERNDPRRQSYARTLALHMDSALRAPELQEALCHSRADGLTRRRTWIAVRGRYGRIESRYSPPLL